MNSLLILLFLVNLQYSQQSTLYTKESYTYYFSRFAEGVFKKYWPLQYKDWHVCVGLGGFLSEHREYYEKHHKDTEEPVWGSRKLGFGGIAGVGASYWLFHRVSLDGFVGGRAPLPFFFENYVKHPSWVVKLTVSYRFA